MRQLPHGRESGRRLDGTTAWRSCAADESKFLGITDAHRHRECQYSKYGASFLIGEADDQGPLETKAPTSRVLINRRGYKHSHAYRDHRRRGGWPMAAAPWPNRHQGPRSSLSKNDGPGTKVLISGGGRCNVTTGIADIRTVLTKYPRGGKF